VTRTMLRALAVLIAVAGVIDPAIARRARMPLAVDVRLPAPSHPSFDAAEALRRELVTTFGDDVVVDGEAPPRAIVAVGTAIVEPEASAPVFALPLNDAAPALAIREVEVPPWTPPGRAVRLAARVATRGLTGRTSEISVRLRGAVVASLQHTWTSDEEVFDAVLVFAPPASGPHRVRVAASGPAHRDVVADALVNVRDEPLRVLAYDARPTWPVTFLRRSLEADGMFEVASTSRTSQPVVTTTGAAPATLTYMNLHRYDAVVVGALDDLRPDDLRALDRFAAARGGTVILTPDRRIPEGVRRQFALPASEEALLDTPIVVEGGARPVRSSELLLLDAAGSATGIAAVPQAGGRRAVIVALQHGEGQVIVSGLLDGYRYRGDEGFDPFWRALVADAAMAARPPIDLRLDPSVARPGDRVILRAELGAELLTQSTGVTRVPDVSASLTSMAGETHLIRLWPGPRIGSFVADIPSLPEGGYMVRVAAAGASAEVPLLVDGDVVRPAHDTLRALEFLAKATGGAVLSDVTAARHALAAIEAGERPIEIRPMRSPWWIVPFAGLLAAEWTIRRRAGLR
jgi:hypothetical protein